jgi:hypothetical protein
MKLRSSILTLAALAAIAAAAPGHARGPGGCAGDRCGGGDPTSVPEPTDAVLLLMGAAGVVIGRRLQVRAQNKR